MPGARGSPALLGRERERAELYDALMLALRGEPHTVLVSGDAGIGKTTLVADLARRAEELGFTVAVGHSVDIEADISFAPVVEAVRVLVAQVESLDSRPLARRMRALLDPGAARGEEQVQLLDALRLTVLEAAASGPVLLVLEDLHWADTSTRDLAVALSRTARGRLLLVLTVRTDDLHRRHPARKALAEICRPPGGRRVDVDPLGRDSIAAIVEAHSQGAPDPALVRSVLAQSEGNPLYAEEILAAGPRTIPDRLSDLFLARVDALADGPRELLRTASVDGTHLDLDTLADQADLDPEQLSSRLRELLDANVLRQVGESLQFRHGLIREATYGDLLPAERTRLHAELAAILQSKVDADPEPRLSTLSRLAFHWTAAHDLPRALVASERAGMVASRVGTSESVTHLERALSLWDRVPDGEALVGRTKIEVVISLAVAMLDRSDGEAWYALTTRAVDMLEPDTSPVVACRAHFSFAFAALHNDDLAGALEAIPVAVAYAGDGPTEERAFCLAVQALLLNVTGHFADGLEVAERAVDASRALEPTKELAERSPLLLALMFKTEALLYLGRMRQACSVAEHSIEVARSAGMVGEALIRVGQLAGRLLDSGRVDEALSVAQEGRSEGLAVGLPVLAANCGEPLVIALTWHGRFDEAESLLGELQDLALDDDEWWQLRAGLLLARGDADGATGVVPEEDRSPKATSPFRGEEDALILLQAAVLLEDEAACVAVASAYLPQVEDCDSPLISGFVARMGFQALTFAQSVPDAETATLRDQAERQLARARRGLTAEWRTSYHGVQLALAEAYAARVAGSSAVEQFREVVALAEPFGAFFVLEPRLDLAQELLAGGDRDTGREMLVDCWGAAHDMGALGLEQRAFRLATRTRVPLPESAAGGGPLSRLTPREREVLDLLATGATNKTLAKELVISEKTVSVHVSNVLAKLEVENRGAAAALARRLLG
jgi:DNA-binding CsgD family transcriptional regulator